MRGHHPGPGRTLALVGIVCAAVQFGSALWLVRDFTAPNASTALARSLATSGTFSVDAWRQLRGPGSPVPATGLRAYHLPGEPLYLALGLRILPPPWQRFLHLPVVLLFVLSVCWAAWSLGGAPVALAAGLIASIDPFVVRHGPVWDDVFLAAALTWLVIALCVDGLRSSVGRRVDGRRLMLVAVAAGCAAATRAEAGALCLLVGALALLPSTRQIRAMGLSAVGGVVVAVAAWGVRNLLVLGVLFFGTSHDGKTLYESNSPFAMQSLLETGSVSSFSQTHLGGLYARVAGLGEVDADRVFRRAAWDYAASHPADAGRTGIVKAVVSLTGAAPQEPLTTVRNIVAVGFNVALLVFGAFGGRRLLGSVPPEVARPWVLASVAAVVLVTMAGLLLGPAGLRYRILLSGAFYIGIGGWSVSKSLHSPQVAPRRVSGATS